MIFFHGSSRNKIPAAGMKKKSCTGATWSIKTAVDLPTKVTSTASLFKDIITQGVVLRQEKMEGYICKKWISSMKLYGK